MPRILPHVRPPLDMGPARKITTELRLSMKAREFIVRMLERIVGGIIAGSIVAFVVISHFSHPCR